jgi:ribosomal protein L19
MNRSKQIEFFVKNYNTDFKKNKKTFAKGQCLQFTKYEDLEYVYSTLGRCLSHRSRGKISSIKIRNISFGVEYTLFIHNPRLVVRY